MVFQPFNFFLLWLTAAYGLMWTLSHRGCLLCLWFYDYDSLSSVSCFNNSQLKGQTLHTCQSHLCPAPSARNATSYQGVNSYFGCVIQSWSLMLTCRWVSFTLNPPPWSKPSILSFHAVCHRRLASVLGSALRSDPASNSADPWTLYSYPARSHTLPVACLKWVSTGRCLSH